MNRSPERDLVLQACQVSPNLAKLKALTEGGIDWPTLQQISHAEGVLPTAYQSLSQALGSDHPALTDLRQRFLGHSLYAFQYGQEFVSIIEGLERAGIPTLGLKGTALILCLHGCQHGFEQLKWVLDVAKTTDLAIDWSAVRQRAGHRRPMVDYALLLAHQLLGSPVPNACQPSAHLFEMAARTERRLRGEVSNRGAALLDVTIAANLTPELSTRGRLGFIKAAIAFACPSTEDIVSVRIPFPLAPLYRVVRLYHLVTKFLARRRQQEADHRG